MTVRHRSSFEAPLIQFPRSLSPEPEPFLDDAPPPESCCEKTAKVALKLFTGIVAVGTKGAFVGFCTGAALSIGFDWVFVNFTDVFNYPEFAVGMAKVVGSGVFGCVSSNGFFRFPNAGIADSKVGILPFLSKVIS